MAAPTRLFVSVAMVLTSFSRAGAQMPDEAGALLRDADKSLALETVAGATKAIENSRRALKLLGSAPAWRTGRPLAFIAQAFLQLRQVDSALVYEQRAQKVLAGGEDPQVVALVFQDLSSIHLALNHPDSAVFYAATPLSLYRVSQGVIGSPAIFLRASAAHIALNQKAEARALLVEAAREGDRVGNPFIVATAFHYLGRLHLTEAIAGDSAIIYFRIADRIQKQFGVTKGQGALYSDISQFYRKHGVVDSALTYARRALTSRELGDRERIIVLMSLSETYAQRGEFSGTDADSAVFYARSSLALARRMNDKRLEADALLRIGVNFARTNKDSAVSFLKQALAVIPPGTVEEGQARMFLGYAELTADATDDAMKDFQAASSILKSVGNVESWEPDFGIGAAYYFKGDFRNASDAIARAFDSRSAIRSSTRDDFLRIAFAESGVLSFDELWTNTWLRQRKSTSDEQASLGALAVTDRVRAQSLRDLMTKRTPIEKVTDFASHGRSLINRSIGADELLLYYRIGADSLTVWAVTKTGAPVVVRRAVSRDSVQTTVGAYAEGLGVKNGSARLSSRSIETMRGAISSKVNSSASFAAASRELSEWLLPPEIRPLLSSSKKVVIVPHGVLGVVPFSALTAGETGDPLGVTHAIRYAPSLGILAAVTEKVVRGEPAEIRSRGERCTRQWSGACPLVVGNPLMPIFAGSDGSLTRLNPLPGAEAEGTEIAKKLNLPPLLGSAATETEVRKRVRNAPVIHLATHGFAYSRAADAASSFVALASDAKNDGFLTMNEVINAPDLDLAATLVVLSACQSGLGSLTDAEGTVGLQRAFLSRGAKTVLVSLWNVSDEATRALMTSFYGHWLDDKDKPSKSESLRRAQTDVRKVSTFSNPKFWAAFQLVGAN